MFHSKKVAAVGLLSAFLSVVALVPGCSTASIPTGSSITLYNGQHPQTTAALVAAFERRSGIHVNVRDNTENVFANQIVQEGSASPADVIYTENSTALQFLASKGDLAPVPGSLSSAVAARFDSPDGRWVGVSARVSVIVYNTSLLKKDELPTSVMDLASTFWHGKLALAPEESDFQAVVSAVALSEGDAATARWLKSVGDNAAGHIYPDNESVTAAVDHGQAAIAVVNDYYWYRLRDEQGGSMQSSTAFFAPKDPGYVLGVSGAAVLSSSHNNKAAVKFLSFLVSPAGQQIIASSESYEYPLGSGATTTKSLVPFSDLQPYSMSVSELGDGQRALTLLREVQLL